MLALGVPQRAVPMAALLGVRLAALAARAALGSGSPAALRHYAAMEVSRAHSCTIKRVTSLLVLL